MPIPAIRTKQTTNTTGTGTLTLNAASAEFRSLNAAYGGASVEVLYSLSRAGVYEIGFGTFNGGSPGTLTRNSVIASSNGGALVSLAAGVTDVFIDFLPGTRAARVLTTSATLALADVGNLVRYTGGSDGTITLPAAATVPPGMGFLVANHSAAWAVVSIDPNGAETIEGDSAPFPLFQNEGVEIFSTGTAWRMGARPVGERLVARAAASSSASIDFVLPLYRGAQFAQFRLNFRRFRPGTDGAVLWLRTDANGGASFDAGASDYEYSRGFVSGAAAWTPDAPAALAQIPLTTDLDTGAAGNTCFGDIWIDPGTLASRWPQVRWHVGGGGNTFAGHQLVTGVARRVALQDVDAVRLLFSTGNILAGAADLFATYD
jgi:hypothetical protein